MSSGADGMIAGHPGRDVSSGQPAFAGRRDLWRLSSPVNDAGYVAGGRLISRPDIGVIASQADRLCEDPWVI